jgi:hypothetical protein
LEIGSFYDERAHTTWSESIAIPGLVNKKAVMPKKKVFVERKKENIFFIRLKFSSRFVDS